MISDIKPAFDEACDDEVPGIPYNVSKESIVEAEVLNEDAQDLGFSSIGPIVMGIQIKSSNQIKWFFSGTRSYLLQHNVNNQQKLIEK